MQTLSQYLLTKFKIQHVLLFNSHSNSVSRLTSIIFLKFVHFYKLGNTAFFIKCFTNKLNYLKINVNSYIILAL